MVGTTSANSEKRDTW